MERKERIKIYGSPSFLYEPSISANDIYALSFADNSKEAKYLPFDELVVSNDSTSDIMIKVNGSDTNRFIVESGTSRVKDDIHFSTLVVEEKSGNAVSSGDLRIEVSREPMNSDKMAQMRASRGTIKRLLEHFIGI